jgi:hypothetical protein
MAKIKAKTQATAAASVEMEGRLHDLALLTASDIMQDALQHQVGVDLSARTALLGAGHNSFGDVRF